MGDERSKKTIVLAVVKPTRARLSEGHVNWTTGSLIPAKNGLDICPSSWLPGIIPSAAALSPEVTSYCRRSGGRGNSARPDGVGRGNSARPGGRGKAGSVPIDGEPGAGDPVDADLTLDSVGGLQEHVAYLKRSILFPLRNKDELQGWGVQPPKGILFHGPPGTGKTLLAKSLVNEVKTALNGQHVAFFYHKGCESFSSSFGETEENLRELFGKAIKNKPSIIFFDEIDGLCPDRGTAGETSQAYVGVVTALLGLIDSVKRGDVFLIGATNRLDSVDAAIRRPGRFDKGLAFPLPDHEARQRIISIRTCKWCKGQPSGDFLKSLAVRTNGFTGSDLEKLCQKALDGAIARSEGDVSAINVTQADWNTAIQSSNASVSSVFGSTIFTPQPMPDVLRPLLANIATEIVQNMRKLIPTQGGKKISGLQSFVVWEREPSSERALHNLIMKEALNDSQLSNLPTYILNFETIGKKIKHNCKIPEAIQDIVNQGVTSARPCILYVPAIDEMCNVFADTRNSPGLDTVFVESLKTLRGSNCLLLATCVGPAQTLPVRLKKLLVGSEITTVVRKTNPAEREQFFRQLFDGLISNDDHRPTGPTNKKRKTSKTANATTPRFATRLTRAVELTANCSIEDTCRLFSTLNTGVETCTRISNVGDGNWDMDTGNEEINFDQLFMIFTTILDDFYNNEL